MFIAHKALYLKKYSALCERYLFDLGHTVKYYERMWNWDRLSNIEIVSFCGIYDCFVNNLTISIPAGSALQISDLGENTGSNNKIK
jgi:hypothetical protein